MTSDVYMDFYTSNRLKEIQGHLRRISLADIQGLDLTYLIDARVMVDKLLALYDKSRAPCVVIEVKGRGAKVISRDPPNTIVHIHDLDYELDQGDLCDICQTAPHLEGDCLCGGCRAELELGKPGSDDDEIPF